MSYVAQTIEALRAGLGPADGSDTELLRFYALLVHTTGTNTTLEDVHTAWALWREQTKPDHADLVEFAQLSDEVADYDRPYRDLIRHVAAEREHQAGVFTGWALCGARLTEKNAAQPGAPYCPTCLKKAGW